ncbi:MAG: carbohydrate ABC transporter permease [Clostridia bacterium]|nr:carbohydrate ABC transporter permease [Clostridia bacterium]
MRAKKKKGGGSVMFTIMLVVLLLYTVSLIVPFIWAFITTFKTKLDFRNNVFGLPKTWAFENYTIALEGLNVPILTGKGGNANFVEMLLNSLVYAIGCTLVNVFTLCTMAYCAAKYNFKFNKIIYGIVIVTMIIPIVGSLASEIQIAEALGLRDSFLGVFFMKMSFLGTNFMIFYAMFKTMSWGYAEAAFIDGAGHFRLYFQIMLPLALPTILIVCVLAFISYWNDFGTPMIYLPSHPVAAYGLYYFQQNTENAVATVPRKLAGCFILCIPIFIIFMLAKDKMIGNLTVGGLKG